MAVTIRLSRSGTNKKPFYHIVVTDSQHPRDGRYIERVGFFNPKTKDAKLRFQANREAIDAWIKKGAKPSERVGHLLKLTAQ